MKGRHFLVVISCILLMGVICYALWFFKAGGVRAVDIGELQPNIIASSYDADTAIVRRNLQYQADEFEKNKSHNDSILKVTLEISEAIGYRKGIFVSAARLGDHAMARDSFLKAIHYFNISVPYARYPENIAQAAAMYRMLGACHSDIGQFNIALGYYNKALEAISKSDVSEKSDDSFDVYNSLAVAWYRLGEQSYSFRMFHQAHDIGVRKNDTQMIIMSLGNIGEAYARSNNIDSCYGYYWHTFRLAEKYHFKSYQVQALGALSQIAARKKNYPLAMDYIKRALSDSLAAGQGPYVRLATLRALGILYKKMKRYDTAEIIFTRSLAEARSLHMEDHIEHYEYSLALLYDATGKHKLAYDHMERYAAIKDSMIRQEKAHVLEAWSNSRIAEKDKEMLRQQLFISRQKNELQQKNLLIIGTLAGAFILVIISTILIRNYRHKQALQQSRIAQLEQKDQIHLLKAKMQGEEEERSRIGRELHDNIASQLWAIKLHIDDMQHDENLVPAQQSKLGFLYRELEHASQDVRKTAHNLMPDLLLEEGLATAMASLCEKTKKNTALNIDFQEYGTIPELDREIELSIYRMFQELVQNVLKHAENATHMLVQLSCNDLLLSLTVEDNGKGFAHMQDGVGLQQIRKRAQTLGAHFDLKSRLGQGTTAYFELDLRQIL